MTRPGADWRGRYSGLCALSAGSDSAARQRRGKEFERVLHDMFAEADMSPRSAYRTAGEEIDGSFLHYGQTMLFEAKWTREPVPASTLYQFRGKLEGKLAGTLGVFISIGGYSADAVDTLVAGKSLNLILFDRPDMDKLAQPHCTSIKSALTLKLRAAAESGTPYFPLPPCTPWEREGQGPRQVIVTEGPADAAAIRALHKAYAGTVNLPPPPPSIVVAGGLQNLPLLALALIAQYPDAERIVIVADGDDRGAQVQQQIQGTLSEAGVQPGARIVTIVIDPAEARAQADQPGSAVGSDLRRLLEVLGLAR